MSRRPPAESFVERPIHRGKVSRPLEAQPFELLVDVPLDRYRAGLCNG